MDYPWVRFAEENFIFSCLKNPEDRNDINLILKIQSPCNFLHELNK